MSGTHARYSVPPLGYTLTTQSVLAPTTEQAAKRWACSASSLASCPALLEWPSVSLILDCPELRGLKRCWQHALASPELVNLFTS